MYGDSQALESLITLLQNEEEEEVLLSAGRAAKQIGVDERTVESLLNQLIHASNEEREKAANALGVLGEQRTINSMIEALKDPGCPKGLSMAIAKALGRMGDHRAVAPLLEMLDRPYEYMLWVTAILSLGKLKALSAVKPLLAAIKFDHDGVRIAAAWALGEIADQRAFEALADIALYDRSAPVRRAAVTAVGKMRDRRALGILKQAFEDEDYYVRERAREAME